MGKKIKILVVGSDARTHALTWKLSGPDRKIYVAPGNTGIAQIAKCLAIKSDDLESLTKWAAKFRPDLTIVGPEDPLIAGIVDKFRAEGQIIFGPTKLAARIEGSKIFSHEVMNLVGVPHPEGWIFLEGQKQLAFDRVKKEGYKNIVIKADGACRGKGAVLPASQKEAEETINEMMAGTKYGEAGRSILIQKRLKGNVREISVMAIVSPKGDYQFLPVATDNKTIYDPSPKIKYNPNTGGMGGHAPQDEVGQKLLNQIKSRIFTPVLKGVAKLGCPYSGILYANIMLTADGPKVLEFNCRSGDPETEIQMPLIENDLYEILVSCATGKKKVGRLKFKKGFTAGVVLAAKGYPDSEKLVKGDQIFGLDKDFGPNHWVFQYAAKAEGDKMVTNGGRILEVIAFHPDSKEGALKEAYAMIGEDGIHFKGMQYRKNLVY